LLTPLLLFNAEFNKCALLGFLDIFEESADLLDYAIERLAVVFPKLI